MKEYSHKGALTADELAQVAAELSARPLPALEGTRLQVMAVDPWNVHAYWHVEAALWHAALAGAGQGAPVLRFDPLGAEERGAVEIEIQSRAGRRYVALERPGRSYSAALGLTDAAGRFYVLARCRAVYMPPAEAPPVREWRWQRLRRPGPAPAPAPDPGWVEEGALAPLCPARRESRQEFPLSLHRAPVAGALPLTATAGKRQEAGRTAAAAGFPLIEAGRLRLFADNARRFRQHLPQASLPALPRPPLVAHAPAKAGRGGQAARPHGPAPQAGGAPDGGFSASLLEPEGAAARAVRRWRE